MDTTEIIKLLSIVFLLLFSGFFSGSEASLFSLTLVQKERVKQKSNLAKIMLDTIAQRPRQLITTILVGNDMVNITASVIATGLFVSLYQESGEWITILVMTPATLIFSEVIPKTLALSHNEKLAPLVSGPLMLFSRLVFPIRWLFDLFSEIIIRVLGIYKQEKEPLVMENDFRDMVDMSHMEGKIHGLERDLIHKVFEFSDTEVRNVMTPFNNIHSIPFGLTYWEIIRFAEKTRHSRLPVYSGKKTNIVGILIVKDLLKVKPENRTCRDTISALLREPVFILETRKVADIFYTLKKKRTHIAICHDEYGDISGLVTLEDLLEEIFGEIYDEKDQEDL